MELVEALDEGNQHQAERNQGLKGDAQKLVGHYTKNLENGVQVPLGENFQRCCKGICLVAQEGGIKNSQTNNTRDGAKDDHREDVEEVVGPSRLTVIVVTHALGELGAELGISEVRLLENVHWVDQYVFVED